MNNPLNNPFADLYGDRDYLDSIKTRLGEVMQGNERDLILNFASQLDFLEAELKPLATYKPTDAVEIGKELLEGGLRSQHFIMPAAGVQIELGHTVLQKITLFEDDRFLTCIVNRSPLIIAWDKTDSSYLFLPALFDNEIIGFLLLLTAAAARDFWTLEERTRTQRYNQRQEKFHKREGTGKARKLAKQKGYVWIPRFRYNLEQYTINKTVQYQARVSLSPHLVSGHVRRLPEGQQASDAAISNAAEFGITVGGDITFVRPYEVGEIEQLRTYRSRSAFETIFGA